MINGFIKFFVLMAGVVSLATADLSAQSPGDTVGTTRMVFQTNGSSGSRIAVDSQYGVHFVWMKLGGEFYPRYVFYNYLDPEGNREEGHAVSENGGGFCQIAVTGEDCAAIAFHYPSEDYVTYAQDIFPGFGIFQYFDPPDMLTYRCYWPYLAVDIDDAIHIVMRENTSDPVNPAAIGYTRSADGGVTWTNLAAVDTNVTISQIMAASPVSGKVVIVYSHPVDLMNPLKNDIYYIESSDGESWDWANGKINVTEYGQPGNLLFAYSDLDAIYDFNDNLHVIWNANRIDGQNIGKTNFLYHFDSYSGAISLVDSVYIDLGVCESYEWNRSINKMTAGINEPSGALFIAYTRFDPQDCSLAGYANGDIFMQYSVDGGASWTEPENITRSQSPGCFPGECYSDLWPSLADGVTDYLHLFYVVDRAGGGDWDGDNPLLYFKYPTPETKLDENRIMPGSFSFSQNYPNPFNARTTIEFELAKGSDVKLSIYDVTGALVEVLHDGYMEAGKQAVVWNAEKVVSGTYFYKLAASEGMLVKKMALVK